MERVKTYPIFPLGIFAFPGEKFTLHIFEERYKQLVEDILNTNHLFAIPFVINGKQNEYGILVELKDIKNKKSNGEMDILVESKAIIKCRTIFNLPSKLYDSRKIEEIKFRTLKPSPRLLSLFTSYLALRDNPDLLQLDLHNISVFELASLLDIPSQQKFSIIEGHNPEDFEQNLINFLLLHIQIETMTKEMGPKFVLN